MLGAGYTLLHEGHVRVDIVYRPAGRRYRAIVDLLGSLLLLLPMTLAVLWLAFPYVIESWRRLEGSREADGLPGIFLLKSVILVFCVLVGAPGPLARRQGVPGARRPARPLRPAWRGRGGMTADVLSLSLFGVACIVLLLGFPVAFSLGGTALAVALVGHALGDFDLRLLGGLPSRYFGVMVNEVLVAVPLFVFMGVMLERSRLAEQLLETMGLLFGRLRGGLGYAVTIVGMLLAASTGIVGATVVTMGLLSLPAMLKAGYDKRLACGVICASGTLGQIIPPSIVLVILGDVLQGANTQAQLAMGNYAPTPVSVVDLFAGAILPGLMLVGLYLGYQVLVAILRPEASPPLTDTISRERLARRVLFVMAPPALLIVAVLGSILFGIATPTEFGRGGRARRHAARRPRRPAQSRDAQGGHAPDHARSARWSS